LHDPSQRSFIFGSVAAANACVSFLSARNISSQMLQLHLGMGIPGADLYAVSFSSDSFPIARQFWEHTGFGLSSRVAEKYLQLFEDVPQLLSFLPDTTLESNLKAKHSFSMAPSDAKATIRERLASLFNNGILRFSSKPRTQLELPSYIPQLSADDVFLYPMGMTAVWSAHQLCLTLFGNLKSVCFGYVTFFAVIQNGLLKNWCL
jgi:cystathionine gamma-synthase